jgi:S-adenosyl methyltransferase
VTGEGLDWMSGGQVEPPELDTSVAHIARVYDYWLGGKDNYAADRAAGDAALQAYPGLVSSVRANRAFLARAVSYLAAEAGIQQFLDIGTGIPTASNTHEVAQAEAAAARVVYVDNDPVVLVHARALLTSGPEGATAYVDADLRDTERILDQAAGTLDFSAPVAVMLVSVLHVIPDRDNPPGIVARLMGAAATGSFLCISHPASDIDRAATEGARRYNALAGQPARLRDRSDVERFFDGLELVEPGVVPLSEWRPRTEVEARTPAAAWGGVARKR